MRAAIPNPILRERRREAFTLVEVLIVVVITAVLAGVVITRYVDSGEDAKASVVQHNIHVLRAQIGLYNLNHLGEYPTLVNNDLPQLTRATNEQGEIGASGPTYPFGPYVDVIPNNPYNNSSKVVAVARPRHEPTAPVGAKAGWQYDQTTGGIWPNHREAFQ